jgi:hypothetical protein
VQVQIEPLITHLMVVLQTTTSQPADLARAIWCKICSHEYKRAVEKLRILAETVSRTGKRQETDEGKFPVL